MGKTFGEVLRGAWRSQDGDAGLARLRAALEVLTGELNRAVDGTPEAQHARGQLIELTEAIRSATERASDELRPELISMLRQANAELRRLSHLDS